MMHGGRRLSEKRRNMFFNGSVRNARAANKTEDSDVAMCWLERFISEQEVLAKMEFVPVLMLRLTK